MCASSAAERASVSWPPITARWSPPRQTASGQSPDPLGCYCLGPALGFREAAPVVCRGRLAAGALRGSLCLLRSLALAPLLDCELAGPLRVRLLLLSRHPPAPFRTSSGSR